MGERASIKITHGDQGHVWLYTHWRGYDIATIAAEGLQRAVDEGRITDASYATRIIFDTLTQLEGGSTGFGIHAGGEEPDSNYECPEIAWHEWGQPPTVSYMGRIFSVSDFLRLGELLTN